MTTQRSLIQASLAEIMPEHIGLRVNMFEIIMFQLKLGQKCLITAFPHGGKRFKNTR